ncbi:MAG: lipocalin-like domain-containing protein [Paracoccaceae bacterium]
MNVKFFLVLIYILLISNIGGAQSNNSKHDESSNKILSETFDLKFPRDHNAHKDFKTEWWYITANLKTSEGDIFGIQWTLFRRKVDSNNFKSIEKNIETPWISNQFWMAHAVITSKNNHFYNEKFSRGGTGQAGVEISPFFAWIDEWHFSSNNDWSMASIKAAGSKFSYNLKLESDGPLIFHGNNGKSIKTKDGHYSTYYSQPFFKVKGTININNQDFVVQGNAWADREWSNAILGSNQEGWDWISLHLDNKTKLMIFRVRDNENGDFYSGTYIFNKKQKVNLIGSDIKMIPLTYSTRINNLSKKSWRVPTAWRVIVKNHNIDLTLNAINNNAFLDTIVPYWEGPVSFAGTHQGFGYLEMTGY